MLTEELPMEWIQKVTGADISSIPKLENEIYKNSFF